MSEAVAMDFDELSPEQTAEHAQVMRGVGRWHTSLRAYALRIFIFGFVTGAGVGALAVWVGGFPG